MPTPEDGRRLPRSGQFTDPGRAWSRAFDFLTTSFVVSTTLGGVKYSPLDEHGDPTGEALFITPEIAAAQTAPNSSEPGTTYVLPNLATYRAGKVAILAVWPGTAQAITFNVWARTGLTATGLPKWVLINGAGAIDPAVATEYLVDAGGRDVFVQVKTGADAGHHVQIAFGVV